MKTMACSLMLGWVAVLQACTAGAADTSEQSVGKAVMLLTATSPSGVQYQLSGTFDITGPESMSLPADGSETMLSVDLAAGDYSILLQDWQLQNVTSGEQIGATLLSPNPQAFAIVANQVVQLAFAFLVDGEDVQFGRGVLEVSVQVDDTESTDLACGDGLDNDSDTFVDCADGDCRTLPACLDSSLTVEGIPYLGLRVSESITTAGITAPLADGGLCSAIDQALAGQIVLCERGMVTFAAKGQNVAASGGLATVVYNNVSGISAGTLAGMSVSVPVVSISQADGQFLAGNRLGATGTLVAD